MSFLKNIFGLILISIFSLAYADAPVVDYSRPVAGADNASAVVPPSVNTASQTSSMQPQFSDQSPIVAQAQSDLTLDQRVAKLEQQINNLNQQNLSKRLDDLQQQLQKISGDLEVQSHAVQQLDEQLKNFYQDLNQRVQKQDVPVKPVVKGDVVKTGSKITAKSAAASTTDTSLKEQQLYQDAFNLLQNKKNQDATTKFRAYISAYPDGNYIANAHYWLGEIYFAGQQFKLATSEFETVINKYSSSTKVPDAMFKLALIYEQAGKHDLSKKELSALQKRFPHSTAAQLAKQQM